MKLAFDFIGEINAKRSGAHGVVLEVSGGIDTKELILAAMEYDSIEEIIKIILEDSFLNRELILKAVESYK